MSGSSFLLLALLIIGILGRSHLVAVACCLLLLIQYSGLEYLLLPFLAGQGLAIGLLILMLYLLLPLSLNQLGLAQVRYNFSTFTGLAALSGGAIATLLNNQGLILLSEQPELIFSMTIGTIIGTIFARGVPCGPVMSAALTAILLQLFQ